ncbi:MAG TPA: hypothetical protein VJT49_04205 [Amycolatopsis sp.]|uniref:hypothetical protein n=1 Tax=Amycolatopsis sp. TaxID=37632 RepID=UPI002B463E2C|nr:hypothetical protein [Amycolatopsis sp.]HKS44314.1 hypothetical protein [Amycolatopsis sp.]
MTGLVELAYTTGGGVIGAVLTNYFAKHQERRQLRADAHGWIHKMTAISIRVRGIELGAPPRAPEGTRSLSVTSELGVKAILDDGSDAHRALREAFAGLSTAVLAAGMPRRVMDFAGGAQERVLEAEVILLADRCAGGVLGADVDQLVRATHEYQTAAVRMLLAMLWHPWRTRLRLRGWLRALRADVAVLHELRQSAVDVLTRPRHANALHDHLDPDGRHRQAWRTAPAGR